MRKAIGREGEKFFANVRDAAAIANFKYSSEQYTTLWLFDQSSCHRAHGEDSLNVRKMNVRPGGA